MTAEWLTTKQAADVLGLSYSTLRRMLPRVLEHRPEVVMQAGTGTKHRSWRWLRSGLVELGSLPPATTKRKPKRRHPKKRKPTTSSSGSGLRGYVEQLLEDG